MWISDAFTAATDHPYALRQASDGTHYSGDDDQPLPLINELECTQGLIYANIWGQDIIVIIDPSNGKVVSFIDLFALYDLTARTHNEVLNGIAYSPSNDAFWVTGKNWPQLYLIKLTTDVRTSP